MNHELDEKALEALIEKAAECGAKRALQKLSVHDLSTHEGRQKHMSDMYFLANQRKGAETLRTTVKRAGVWTAVSAAVAAGIVAFLNSLGIKAGG